MDHVCKTSFAQNLGRAPPPQKCTKLILHTFWGGGPPPPQKCAKLPVREGEPTEALYSTEATLSKLLCALVV